MARRKRGYTLDKKKFFIFIMTIIIISTIIIVIISLNKNIKLSNEMDISKVDANKYSSQILDMYNQESMKEKFLSEYNDMQNKIGIYIINNSTSDENSFKDLVNDVNNKLSKEEFEKLDITFPTFWNGNWFVNEKAKLQFRFKNSSIEPNWIGDLEIKEIVIKNN